MHLELGAGCILYWHLLQIARESYHLRHLELNYDLPPAKSDFKPLLEKSSYNTTKREFCIPKDTATNPRAPTGAAGAPCGQGAQPAKATMQQARNSPKEPIPASSPLVWWSKPKLWKERRTARSRKAKAKVNDDEGQDLTIPGSGTLQEDHLSGPCLAGAVPQGQTGACSPPPLLKPPSSPSSKLLWQKANPTRAVAIPR